MLGPDSSYSCLVIHIVWKVERLARVEAPSHAEKRRSDGAWILIFIVEGARQCISYHRRSAMPSNSVLPPERIKLP